MPFTRDDFFVGMIVYFKLRDVLKQPDVRASGKATPCAKSRPFVCFHEHDGDAYWTYLTGTWNPDRRTVSRQWLRNPRGRFLQGDLIIGDATNAYAGPIETFARLSKKYDEFDGYKRPFLTPDGVAEVHHIVSSRNGLTPMNEHAMLAHAA